MQTDKTDRIDKEDKLILSRAEDAMKLAERNYSVKAVGFLNPRQRSLIMKNLYPSRDIKAEFVGGYPDAERTMLVCRPEYAEFEADDILSVIHISGRNLEKLTHRDYLGSLMGLGITRENIGDILVESSGAFIFVKQEIADYITNNLEKIGRCGVKTLVCGCAEANIPKPKLREVNGTVSSLRIDAVLSAAAGISRGRAAEMIGQGLVSLNWEEINSASKQVEEGDLISARGVGRMRLERVGNLTRKGRIGITIVRFE